MISRTSKRFRRRLDQLPMDVQRQAREAYELFRGDPSHPSLRFKRIHATRLVYSVRISSDYRALGVVAGGEVVWFWIGSHNEYEKLIAQL